jgi:hypothetical protein
MNHTFDALSGSPGFSFETTRQEDGSYKVTCPTIEGMEWVGADEREAIMNATREAYDMAARGELFSRN